MYACKFTYPGPGPAAGRGFADFGFVESSEVVGEAAAPRAGRESPRWGDLAAGESESKPVVDVQGEASVLGGLDHPHIVRLFESFRNHADWGRAPVGCNMEGGFGVYFARKWLQATGRFGA